MFQLISGNLGAKQKGWTFYWVFIFPLKSIRWNLKVLKKFLVTLDVAKFAFILHG